ncbi:MAG: hypothetical protein FWC39_11055 [Bacteroidetes bacterium]|nr:hypothetical protein [Bacteroidota bacterium]
MKKLTTILCSVLIAASALAQNPDSTYRYFLWGGIESKTKPKERENHYRVTFYKGNPTALDKFKYDETVPDPSTYDVGVKIGETVWATRNVDEFGKFAANPQDAGKFYQWNCKVAWSATEEIVTGWEATPSTGTTWEKANNPCPTGWRVPTKEEQEALIATGGTWTSTYNDSSVAGYMFGSGNNRLFFPAAGYRTNGGALFNAGSYGYYWSSTDNGSIYAYYLYFYSDNAGMTDNFRASGRFVRCVKE